jgi:hypothetical protein
VSADACNGWGSDFADRAGSVVTERLKRCLSIALCVLLAAASTTPAEDLFQSAPGPEAPKPKPRPQPPRQAEPQPAPAAPPAAAASVPPPPAASTNRPQDWVAIGLYRSTNTVFSITQIDPDGTLHGQHQGTDNHGTWKPPDEFTAHPGADGYPEYTVWGNSNRYSHIHACEGDFCATFHNADVGTLSERRLKRQ